ncbi:TIR domain-containing protein [Neoroseomonas lacus]|nr:TIR domain-containing protein [Neoroseomonas lacus]
MPHDVFLSYASTDRAAAEAVCAALETRGIRCWIAPRDVPAGADWGEAILTAIGRAHAMVLVLSRATANSVHVRNEVVTAVSQSLALVPVRIEDCQPGGALRLHLAGSHWLNVFPMPIEQHADVLAVGVRLALAADATVEIPRAQAMALVAAARASHAAAPAVAPPARAAPPRVAPARAVPAGVAVAQASAEPTGSRRRAGAGVMLGLGVVLLLMVLGAAAWFLEPRLRSLLGAAPAAPSAVTGTAAPGRADAAPSAMTDRASDRSADPIEAAVADRARHAGVDPARNGGAVATPADPPPRSLAPSASLAGLGGLIPLPDAGVPAPLASVPRPTAAPSSPDPLPASIPPPVAAPATRLLNVASITISRLFVSPVSAGVGREDWLGNAQITPGNAVQIRAPEGQGCVFNIRAVYVGGRTEDRPGVDLCAAPELRFEGGKNAGGASSR